MARVVNNSMKNHKKDKLINEYFDKLNGNVCQLFRYLGFFRFDIKSGKFTKNSLLSTLRSITIHILLNFCCLFFVYKTITDNILTSGEMIMVIVLTIYANSVFLNVNFINRNSYFKMFKVFLDIDGFIGIRETKFMRDVTHKLFQLQLKFYLFITLSTIIFITPSYIVHKTLILFLGLLLIAILYATLTYINFLVISYIFLSMRVRYLNITLLKLYNMEQYNIFIRKSLFFDGIIWKEHFVDNVVLKIENLVYAYRLVLKLLRHMEASFQFLLFSGACLVTTALFLGIQFIINYLKYDEPKNKLQILMITLWIPISWMLKVFTGLIADIFLNEITSAQLICMDMMLDPNLDEKYRQVAETIFQLLKVHNPQLSVYGMYSYNSTTVVKSTTALIVFIIMQLQYSYPPKLDAKKHIDS